MSGTINFWTESFCRESFAVMMIDLIAEKYLLKNGQTLFMSKDTSSKIPTGQMIGEATLDLLEAPLNFQRFEKESKLLLYGFILIHLQ